MIRFQLERERAIERSRTRLALLALMASSFLFGLALVSVLWAILDSPSAGEYVQQKIISLRVRAGEYFDPPVPRFLPTPFTSAAAFGSTDLSDPATDSGQTLVQGTPYPVATSAPTPTPTRVPVTAPTRAPVPAVQVSSIKPVALLTGVKHDWQRWNNCAPTTLEMNLSYYGRQDTQAQIAAFTKPNPEDKNVRPDELAAYVATTNLRSLTRVNGTLDRLKLLISNGVPVMAETAYVKQPQGWMGHYRLFIGYDDRQFTAMDSYDGPNQRVPFTNFDDDWRAFNRLYFVVYRPDQDALVRSLLADTLDDQAMYSAALAQAQAEFKANPKNAFAKFNEGSSLVAMKRYGEAAAAFDQARVIGLPWRMLWYQFTPYEAYLQAQRYDEVIGLADATLKTSDDLEEAHYYKGLALRAIGRADEARREFEIALKYNKNYRAAQRALGLTPSPGT